MIVKLLTEHHLEVLSLTGGLRGSSESALVKMSNCWKLMPRLQFCLEIITCDLSINTRDPSQVYCIKSEGRIFLCIKDLPDAYIFYFRYTAT